MRVFVVQVSTFILLIINAANQTSVHLTSNSFFPAHAATSLSIPNHKIEIVEDIKEIGEASMGVNSYGTNVEGRADIKPVTKITDATAELAEAGMGENAYGTNVDMK